MNKKVIIGLGIGCAALCIVLVIAVLIAGGVLIKWGLTKPENVSISLDAPVQASKDESVIITVRVENTATESQLLHSIDISSQYLDGIAIEEAEPPFSESFAIPLVDMQSYTFGQDISPGTTLEVRFAGVAVKIGDFAGNFDVCINSGNACTTLATRTVIDE
jgi:hypothetical protein